MTSVTFPPALGGDGSTVSDDADPVTGLRNAGYKTRFVPALQQTINVVQAGVNRVAAVAVSEAVATTKASEARASELAAAGYANAAMRLALDVNTLRPSVAPSLLLDFERSQSVPPSVRVLRSTTAWTFGPDRKFRAVAANLPRIYFDPNTGRCRGVLREGVSTNLLRHSGDLSQSVWTKNNVDVNVEADEKWGSVSRLTAVGSGKHDVFQSFTAALQTQRYFYVKAVNHRYIGIANSTVDNGGGAVWTVFDTTTGAYTQAAAPTAERGPLSVENMGDGWFRIGCFRNAVFLGRLAFFKSPTGDLTDSQNLFVADGEQILVAGAQCEESLIPSSYIPTAASTVTRATERLLVEDLSPWFSLNQGTFFVDFTPLGKNGSSLGHSILALGASTNNLFHVLVDLDGRETVGFDNPLAGNVSNYFNVTGRRIRAALAYSNDVALGSQGAIDGVLYPVQPPANLGESYVRLSIGDTGRTSDVTAIFNGFVAKVAYFPQRLANSAVQSITG